MRLIFRSIAEFVALEDTKLFSPDYVSARMRNHRPNCFDKLF